MGTILPSRLRSPFEHTGEAKVALFPRLPLLAEGSCLPQQTEGFPLRDTLWAFFAPSGGRGELRSPLSPHRNVFSKHPGVPHGLFYDQAILWLDLQNTHAPGSLRSPSDAAPKCFFKTSRCSARLIRQAETLELQPRSRPPSSHTVLFSSKRSTSSRFAASGGRGELRSPLHPPLPPPLFIGRFAAFDRQIPKEDVFIPPNAAFAQLSLAHSAAFCYSFLNNRTRCGKRRLLP